jgi:hypothetical protein
MEPSVGEDGEVSVVDLQARAAVKRWVARLALRHVRGGDGDGDEWA